MLDEDSVSMCDFSLPPDFSFGFYWRPPVLTCPTDTTER